MEKKNFVNQMKDISSLGNKSVTVSKQDFDKLVEYAEPKGASGHFFASMYNIQVKDGLIVKMELTGGIGGE